MLFLLFLASVTASAEKLTLERMFAAPDLSGATLRSPKISPDGRLVAYLRAKSSDNGQLDLWAFDIAAGSNRLLVDSTSLAPQEQAPSAEEAQRRERQRIAAFSGIVEYQFAPDSTPPAGAARR